MVEAPRRVGHVLEHRTACQRARRTVILPVFCITFVHLVMRLLHPTDAAQPTGCAFSGPGGFSNVQKESRNTHHAAASGFLPSRATNRRDVWFATAVGGIFTWAESPPAAQAFRTDRLLAVRDSVTPKIRSRYQKLEGLRDDIYIQIELKTGDAGSRIQIPARPADWYDGLDSKLDGQIVLPTDKEGLGCSDYVSPVRGAVVFMPRGRCTFEEKMEFAAKAGAKSVIVYDEKMTKAPVEAQGRTGRVANKGIATRTVGDALTGGASITPRERGITVMAVQGGKDVPRPKLDAAMVSRDDGLNIMESINAGDKPRVLDIKRFDFNAGIDKFIEKDLKKLMTDMETYSLAMRSCKECMKEPILRTLANDRKAFEQAVKSKDYGAIQRTFAEWNSHLDPLGQWDLAETI